MKRIPRQPRAGVEASPPTRGRGLKRQRRDLGRLSDRVAPHAGARIETLHNAATAKTAPVAPHAGARIETKVSAGCRNCYAGRPPRGGAD